MYEHPENEVGKTRSAHGKRDRQPVDYLMYQIFFTAQYTVLIDTKND